MIIHLPDDVDYDLPIEHMAVKDSLFIPTLQIDATRNQVLRLAETIEIKLTTKATIVDGYLGLLVSRFA